MSIDRLVLLALVAVFVFYLVRQNPELADPLLVVAALITVLMLVLQA